MTLLNEWLNKYAGKKLDFFKVEKTEQRVKEENKTNKKKEDREKEKRETRKQPWKWGVECKQ